MDTAESIKKKPKAKKVIKRKTQRREKSRGSLVVENIGEVGKFIESLKYKAISTIYQSEIA